MRRALLALLYAATLAILAGLAWHGREYYALSLLERPRHPLHWELKPGGELGRLYGVAGASLMLVMHSYSLRKRLPFLKQLGTLRDWLDFHIWCGVTGPLLVVLHSALKIGGLIAIAFWSMVAVALSGILGRFLYAQIPRTAAGDQLSLDEARRLEATLTERLRSEFGLASCDVDLLAEEKPLVQDKIQDGNTKDSTMGGVVWALVGPLRYRRRFLRFRETHLELAPGVLKEVRRVGRQRAVLVRRLAVWRRTHELFHYWHVFHKPFAILMYLFVLVHVGVAWATGYAGPPSDPGAALHSISGSGSAP